MRENPTAVRNAARVALAVVIGLGGLLLMPRPASRFIAPDASAQVPAPTPTIPGGILPTLKPSPTPTPTPTPKPKPTKSPDKDPEKDPEKPGPGTVGPGKNDPTKPGTGNKNNTSVKGGPGKGGKKGTGNGPGNGKKNGVGNGKVPKPAPGVARIPGSYSTDSLVAVASRLRSLGTPGDEVVSKVFSPFIIGGEAAWIDTWGAPRYGPGSLVRTHQGQDVFCNYGDPVLAAEDGTVEFADGGLGGRVARLHRADGSYWYYAHLSEWNTKDFRNGDRVQVGDIIGYCGNTGNALTTPPHVHFGWYQANGIAKNPMRQLIRWLQAAESKSGLTVTKITNERVENIEPLTLAHRFGDAFAPDMSEVGIAGESLWASGSSPTSATLSLAQSALQAALSSDGVSTPTAAAEGGDDLAGPARADIDPDSEMARILFGDAARAGASNETAD